MKKSEKISLNTGWTLALILGCLISAMFALIFNGRLAFVTPDEYTVRVKTDYGVLAVRCQSTKTTIIGGDTHIEVKGASATYPIHTTGGYSGWIGLDQLGQEKFIPAQMWGEVNFHGRNAHVGSNWVTSACLGPSLL